MAGKRIAFCGPIIMALVLAALEPSRILAQSCSSNVCSGDADCNGRVTIDEVLSVVNNALNGCPVEISDDQACTNLAVAQCAKLDQCVVNGATSRYGGVSICEARQKAACMVRLSAAGTGNNASYVAQCATDLPTASCSEFDLGDVPECQARIGTIPNGQACAFDGQCQSANCAIVTGTNCGTCAAPNQAGASCATTSCSRGLFCVKSTQLCEPRGDANAACDPDHPCGAGLSCVTPGTCQPAANSVGAACDPQRQTAASCDPNLGLFCDAATKKCHAVTYTVSGGQCGFVSPIVVACTDASTCFGAQGSTPGNCFPIAADGTSCDTQLGPSCLPPARCVTVNPTVTSGVCRLPDPNACS